jgi:hypothetical protein
MAQTVALQRGTTTVNGNNGTVTLFTQSGGNATRVIVNQLGFYASTASRYGLNIGVYLASSGGQTTFLGRLYEGPQSSSRFQSQFVLTGGVVNLNGANIGTSNNMFPTLPSLAGYSGTNTDMGGISLGDAALNYSSSSNQYYGFLPTNFFMGPSDSIKVKAYWYTTSGKSTIFGTVNVGYSFTTVTES